MDDIGASRISVEDLTITGVFAPDQLEVNYLGANNLSVENTGANVLSVESLELIYLV